MWLYKDIKDFIEKHKRAKIISQSLEFNNYLIVKGPCSKNILMYEHRTLQINIQIGKKCVPFLI